MMALYTGSVSVRRWIQSLLRSPRWYGQNRSSPTGLIFPEGLCACTSVKLHSSRANTPGGAHFAQHGMRFWSKALAGRYGHSKTSESDVSEDPCGKGPLPAKAPAGSGRDDGYGCYDRR